MKTSFEVIKNLSSFIDLEFEPAGKWFHHYSYLKHQGEAGFEEEIAESSSESEDEIEVEETAEYLEYLAGLDPKNWKDQDHYKVLGIESLRYKATQHQIKRAHKSKVLKHHPDKKKENSTKERDYFTCITKAFEQLSDPVKRIAFDSVDPTFDDEIPSVSESSKRNFYKVFGKAFESNKRWSVKKQVPTFGDENSTFDQVNDFYSFWYDFDSWREFSYLDEENKDTATDRDERRWIDKQNKAARAKRKKEEVVRIRQLVDNAYACDPRIIKFKQDEKRRKEEEKAKKKEAARLREEEQARKLEEARLEKEKLEEQEKQRIENEKKEREQVKKQIKKERKQLRTVVKEYNYYSNNETEKIDLMERIEHLIESLSLNDIQKLNENIQKDSNNQNKKESSQKLIFDSLKTHESKDNNKENKSAVSIDSTEKTIEASASTSDISKNKEWCDDEVKLLVKGVQMIPMGTRDRWDVVAHFIEEHSRGKFKRTGKEVLTKTKEMQKLDPSAKEEINKKAYEKTLQNIKADVAVQDNPTERYSTPGEQFLAEQGSNLAVWSSDEQKILEQALKTYPATMPDRWDKIAECLPSRSKKRLHGKIQRTS